MAKKMCTNCGYIGKPKKINPGNIVTEFMLWLFFLVPGIIYTFWRIAACEDMCPKCKSRHMIPEDAPFAQDYKKRLNR